MMARTRKGVLGAERNRSGKPRRAHRVAARHDRRRRSDMAEHDFSRTPPAYRHEIADSAADDQQGRARAMTETAIPVEERRRKQTLPKLAGHQLPPMQMSRQNEVKACMTKSLPDARVVGAQNA